MASSSVWCMRSAEQLARAREGDSSVHYLQNLEACVRASAWLFSELVPTVARRSDESLQGSLLSMPISSLYRVQGEIRFPSSSQQPRQEGKLHVREMLMASVRWVQRSPAPCVYEVQYHKHEGVVLRNLQDISSQYGFGGAKEMRLL